MARRKRKEYRPVSPGRRCGICGHVFPVCRNLYSSEHEFVSLTAERRQRVKPPDPHARAVISDQIAEIRAQLRHLKEDE